MNARCRGVKRNGVPCAMPANDPDGYCWAHSPNHAEQRRLAARKAGKSKPTGEVKAIKAELRGLIEDVKSGALDPTTGNTVGRLYGVLLDYIKTERGIYLEEDLTRRVEELKGERPRAS